MRDNIKIALGVLVGMATIVAVPGIIVLLSIIWPDSPEATAHNISTWLQFAKTTGLITALVAGTFALGG